MESRKSPKSNLTANLTSRPDADTEEIINTAVQMVMEVGLSAAEEYLRDKGVSRKTALRVLGHNAQARRKPR